MKSIPVQPDDTFVNVLLTLVIGRNEYTLQPRRGLAPGKGYKLTRTDGTSEVATQAPDGSMRCSCAEFNPTRNCPHLRALVDFGLFTG